MAPKVIHLRRLDGVFVEKSSLPLFSHVYFFDRVLFPASTTGNFFGLLWRI